MPKPDPRNVTFGYFCPTDRQRDFFSTWTNSYGHGPTAHQNSLKSMGVRMVSHLTKCLCLLTDPWFCSRIFLYCEPTSHWQCLCLNASKQQVLPYSHAKNLWNLLARSWLRKHSTMLSPCSEAHMVVYLIEISTRYLFRRGPKDWYQ